MRTIALSELTDSPDGYQPIADALDRGGIVCMPHQRGYRLLADVTDAGAVTNLLQAKRRTRHAPCLIFVDTASRVAEVGDLGPLGERLAERFWPGPLTILVSPNGGLPRKLERELTKANKHLGVRVPEAPVIRDIIAALGRPVLVSSANREKRKGEGSAALVRQTFGRQVEVFIDAGDITADAQPSTVVREDEGKVLITRAGAISADAISELLSDVTVESA